MKNIIIFFYIACFCCISSYGQAVENGIVKEYHGKNAKTALAGVELMVHGAPSTVSDIKGTFSLKFATYKPGDPINYSEIYKDGYVIFNKEALDSWRISSNGKPFTIVMCKETDFRQLKKKFYEIIEKSYRSEYERQKEIAERNATDAMQLRQQLQMIEKEYNQKMADINTYVELFSRIDRNEMDSVEAKALDYMEAGEIDKAIKTYEELHLEKTMKDQLSKWDAADEMHKAANNMESEVQSDLTILASKMQKQVSLYRMGGYQYNSKKYKMIDDLITLLYRLRPATGNQYNETLGTLLIERSEIGNPQERFKYHKDAAALPSVAGLIKLAGDYEGRHPSEELIDSINSYYHQALELNNNDSIFNVINEKMEKIPDGFFLNTDGRKYPYKICGKDSVILCSNGPYFSTHIEGEVKLPDNVRVGEKTFRVVGVGNFAFGKNYKLKKVYLPEYCKFLGSGAFAECDSLSKIMVNAVLESIDVKIYPSIPIHTEIEFPYIPEHQDWILERLNYMQEQNDSTINLESMVSAIANWAEKNNQKEYMLECLEWLVNFNLSNKDFENAILNANRCKNIDKFLYHKLLGVCYYNKGEYEKAVIEGEKSLKDKNPNYYNDLAYFYIADKWEKKDYANAHRCIDKAILLAQTPEQKATFLDSKGEIFLKEGLYEKAQEYLDKALACDSAYHTMHYSPLYQYFHPDYISASGKNKQKELELLYRERNIAVSLMAFDYVRPRIQELEDFKMDSICLPVLELMAEKADIENMNKIEEVFKNAVMQIGSHLYTFALEKGIPFNNEWLGMLDAENRNGMAAESENMFLLTSIHEVHKNLPCNKLTQSDVERLNILDSAIKQYIGSLDSQKQSMLKDMLKGKDIFYLINKYQCPIDTLKDFIYMTFDKVNEFIQPIESGPDINVDHNYAARYDETVKALIEHSDQAQKIKRKKLIPYIEIAKRCAKLESQFIPEYENFIGVPYEELLSIGIIAVNVLWKNKTAEQIQKYNSGYVATAIRWAMRNELKIRYPWYMLVDNSEITTDIRPEESKDFEKERIDIIKLKTRIAIYKTLIGISKIESSPLSIRFDFEKELNDDNEYLDNVKAEFDSIAMIIKVVSSELQGDMKKCYDYIFSSDFQGHDLEKYFSAKTIDETLNYIKLKINELGFEGY